MIDFFSNNPLFLIALFCGCWPGLLPIVATFYLARNYDFSIQPRQRRGGEEIEI